MKTLTIFDIDGTITNPSHRMKYINPTPSHHPDTGKKVKRRFDLFHNACDLDTPIAPVVNIYRRFIADPNVIVVLLTGRPDSVRDKTEAWFVQHGLTGYDELFLKTGDQHIPDFEQKAMIADQVEAKYGQPIDMVFEDRQRVVAMWKARGTFVFDVLQHPDD
jgi:hypothetical protein